MGNRHDWRLSDSLKGPNDMEIWYCPHCGLYDGMPSREETEKRPCIPGHYLKQSCEKLLLMTPIARPKKMKEDTVDSRR